MLAALWGGLQAAAQWLVNILSDPKVAASVGGVAVAMVRSRGQPQISSNGERTTAASPMPTPPSDPPPSEQSIKTATGIVTEVNYNLADKTSDYVMNAASNQPSCNDD